jgi:hypothetical protein
MKRIGDDRREATDWIQDRLKLTRPEAEFAIVTMLKENVAVTTDEGIFLTEDEEEGEKEARRIGKQFSKRISRRRTSRKMTKNVRKLEKQYNNKVPKKDDEDKDKGK